MNVGKEGEAMSKVRLSYSMMYGIRSPYLWNPHNVLIMLKNLFSLSSTSTSSEQHRRTFSKKLVSSNFY